MSPDGDARLAVHSVLDRSQANGPGRRAVLWVQGCDLGCPGCYNSETHAEATATTSVADLVAWLESLGDSIEGLSISGGEPLSQAAGVLALVRELRATVPALSILVFSGFALAEIERKAEGRDILAAIDVLIDGRYVAKLHRGRSLRGSENQRIHLLSDRYTLEEVEATPATEVTIGPDGSIVLTGVSPLDL